MMSAYGCLDVSVSAFLILPDPHVRSQHITARLTILDALTATGIANKSERTPPVKT